MGSVCWYCCSEPKEVDPTVLSNARYLGQVTELPGTSASTNNEKPEANGTMEEKVRRDVLLPQGFYASELKMDPSNFEVNENLEEEYLAGIEEYRDLRQQEEAAVLEDGHRRLNGDNYADVRYRYVNVLFNKPKMTHSLDSLNLPASNLDPSSRYHLHDT